MISYWGIPKKTSRLHILLTIRNLSFIDFAIVNGKSRVSLGIFIIYIDLIYIVDSYNLTGRID